MFILHCFSSLFNSFLHKFFLFLLLFFSLFFFVIKKEKKEKNDRVRVYFSKKEKKWKKRKKLKNIFLVMNFLCFWVFVIYNILSFEIRLIQFHRNLWCFWEICYERCIRHFSLSRIIKRNWLSELITNSNTLVILFSVFYDCYWSNKCLLVERRNFLTNIIIIISEISDELHSYFWVFVEF